MLQLIFSASNLVDRAGLEPATFRLSGGCTAHPCSRSVEPRARVELASPLYRSGASPAMLAGLKLGASGANRTLIGRLPCDCSATELHRLEPKGGFEPPSERYEGSVFPTKLLRPLSDKSLERVTGFEPVSGPWQGPILAARRYPRGASGENRTLLACLEGRNSSNKSRSLEVH